MFFATRSRQDKSSNFRTSKFYTSFAPILIGLLLNTLDAVSSGLLIFPPAESHDTAFSGLQVQAMSMFLMSTIASQIVLTLGGSLFPGALGSMLLEILPFLRGIANSIRDKLGDDNPALVPTVMAAYAMTSFLTGVCFFLLGVLRCGRLVEYFFRTVLTGAIGAIGISLFIYGLELTFPPFSDKMTLSTAGRILFSHSHIGLLFASVLPALALSLSIRSSWLSRITKGTTHAPLYVPIYVLGIAGIFWIIVAGRGLANKSGRNQLAANGWLFTVEPAVQAQTGIGTSWIYWRLFDFRHTEWWAIQSAISDICFLVVIAIINLPIYVPAMALSLDVPFYNMDRELLGHGASNILSGILGTVPNLVVFSYTVLFTRAGGGRFEATIVTVLTVVLLFVSSLILPYVPTILASTFVLFMGIELFLTGVWESGSTLLWSEWIIVIITLFSCSFLGFAPGFGVGIGTAFVFHVGWSLFDTRARTIRLCDMRNRAQRPQHRLKKKSSRMTYSTTTFMFPPTDNDTDIEIADEKFLDVDAISFETTNVDSPVQEIEDNHPDNIRIIQLTGYAFFGIIPSLEAQFKVLPSTITHIIVDLNTVYRVETSVAEFLERKARESISRGERSVIVCGIEENSSVAVDLQRGGVVLLWNISLDKKLAEGVQVVSTLKEAIRWAEIDLDRKKFTQRESGSIFYIRDFLLQVSDSTVMQRFVSLFGQPSEIFTLNENTGEIDRNHARDITTSSDDTINQVPPEGIFKNTSALIIRRYSPGQIILRQNEDIDRLFFLVEGRIDIINDIPLPDNSTKGRHPIRTEISSLLLRLGQYLNFWNRTTHVYQSTANTHSNNSVVIQRLLPGDILGLPESYMPEPRWEISNRVCAHPGQTTTVVEMQRKNSTTLQWDAARQWIATRMVLRQAEEFKDKMMFQYYRSYQ